MSGDHDPDHDHTDPPSDAELRIRALESLLVEKGVVDPAAVDAIIDLYAHPGEDPGSACLRTPHGQPVRLENAERGDDPG